MAPKTQERLSWWVGVPPAQFYELAREKFGELVNSGAQMATGAPRLAGATTGADHTLRSVGSTLYPVSGWLIAHPAASLALAGVWLGVFVAVAWWLSGRLANVPDQVPEYPSVISSLIPTGTQRRGAAVFRRPPPIPDESLDPGRAVPDGGFSKPQRLQIARRRPLR